MKNQYNKKYSLNVLGEMTVNERLFHCNLFDEFDDAMKNNKEKARQILKEVFVDDFSIERILKQSSK